MKHLLEACLHSVIKASEPIDAEIFVVDNASTDGSKEYLEPIFPNVNFRWNTQNVGFSKANNSVLKDVSGEVVLFLNPDTIVPEDCFNKCLTFITEHSDCGALGVHMTDGNGRFLKESKRGFPGPLTSLFKMLGIYKIFPHSSFFAKYYEGHLPDHQTNTVEVLSGAFMMMPKAVLDKVTGFDEDFFMYGEDIDLSYRISKAGYNNYYFAETSIIHFKGESTQKKSVHYTRHFYGAMNIFVNKHYTSNPIGKLLMLLAISFGKAIATIKRVLFVR